MLFLHVFAYDFIRFYSSCSEVMPAFPNLAPTTRHLVHMNLFGVRVVRALFGLVRAFARFAKTRRFLQPTIVRALFGALFGLVRACSGEPS